MLTFYIIPTTIIPATLVLQGLKYWWESNNNAKSVNPGIPKTVSKSITRQLNERFGFIATCYYLVPEGYMDFTTSSPHFLKPMLALFLSHVGGFIVMYTATSKFSIILSSLFIILYGSILIPRIIGNLESINKRNEFLLLKSLICTELGIGFSAITTINPSLSLIMSIWTVPIFMFLKQGNGLLKYIQFSMMVFCIPINLLMFISGSSSMIVGGVVSVEHLFQVFLEGQFNYEMFGSMFHPFVSLFYTSLVISGFVLIFF